MTNEQADRIKSPPTPKQVAAACDLLRDEGDANQRYQALIADYLEAQSEALQALQTRVGELERALKPFAKAADNIPDDQGPFKVVAHVPAGPHAAQFRAMSAHLTAGNFRVAKALLASLTPPLELGK